MSDVASSLPVRTQNNGDVVVRVGDGATPSQQLAIDATGRPTVKLNDGSGNAVTSQVNGAQRALDVGINVAGVQIDPRQVRALTAADVVTVQQGTTPWATKDLADGPVAPGTAATVSLLSGMVYNSAAPAPTNGQQLALQSDAAGNLKVDLATAIPAGANLIGGTNVFVGGTIASATNPVPVTISTVTPGTAVQSYATSAAVAPAASATLTYTVPASKAFTFQRVFASASGKIKVVVQLGASTIFVGFNSTANPNVDIAIMTSPSVAAAGTVNVIITNLDLLAQDVYATIEGNLN